MMMDHMRKRRMLMELAERKLGKGATILINREGWVAASPCGRSRITGKTRSILEWFLREMPDPKPQENDAV